jgi:DNA-binding MarR family transcriptional regulator
MKTMDLQSPAEIDGSTELGDLDGLIGYHLRRANHVFSTDFARVLEGRGMRQVLFGILSMLSTNPGLHQGAVGRSLGIQRANMVALVNELAEAGLVERRTSPEDRRAFALFLTPAGQVAFEQCRVRLFEHEDALLAGFSQAERQMLLELLRRFSR